MKRVTLFQLEFSVKTRIFSENNYLCILWQGGKCRFSTFSAPFQHLSTFSAPSQYLGTCSAPDAVFGAWYQHFPPWIFVFDNVWSNAAVFSI